MRGDTAFVTHSEVYVFVVILILLRWVEGQKSEVLLKKIDLTTKLTN